MRSKLSVKFLAQFLALALAAGSFSTEVYAESKNTICQATDNDFIAYWEKCANQVEWFKKWDQTMTGVVPDVRWFEGGKLNISYNCLDRHIKNKKGDKIALIALNEVGGKRILTYNDLYNEVNRLANVMKNLGVGKGDRVAIYMPMTPEAIASMLACARIGAVHTVIFGGVGAISVKERILDAEAKLLITADGSYRSGKKISYKNAIDAVLDECPCIQKTLVLKNTGEPATLKKGRDYWYQDLVKQADGYIAPEQMDAEDPLFILYTSGTTGKPKGILHTTGGYLVGVAETFKLVFNIKPEDIFWCTADVGWITGHSYVVYGPMANQATQVIYEGSFDYPQKNQFSKIIDENKVSIFYTAPTLIRMFMQWGSDCLRDAKFDSLRLLGSIGEPINPESWQWFHKNIGHERCPIVDTWFQTETGALVISPIPWVTHLKPGSVTKALPGFEVAVLDEEGNRSSKGFLAILKPYPSMMRGIYKDHDRYVKTYWSKWGGKYYFAGDISTCDEDGYIWVGGRCDEVLKVAGHRIGTAEVENAIIEHPTVAESAVVGIKDDLKGQKIVAFVVLKKQAAEGVGLEEEIKETVVKNLGAYCRPTKIVLVNGLPKTRSGKILRRVLKNLVEGDPVGNISTLSDPSVLEQLEKTCFQLRKEYFPETILPELAQFSQKPQFSPLSGEKVGLSSIAIQKMVQPILQKHLADTNYDRIHLVEQYIDFYHAQKKKFPHVTPLQVLANFQPDTSTAQYRGSSCYGLTDDLFTRLPKELKAVRVCSTLPKRFQQNAWPKVCHTGIVIAYENPQDKSDAGYVLVDPNFDIEVPIVLRNNGAQFFTDMKELGRWNYKLAGDTIECRDCEDLKNPPIMCYYLKEYLNPIQVGVKPMIATDRKISLLSRNGTGHHQAHLNVQLDKDIVTSSIKYVKQDPINFSTFLQGQGFSNDFAKELYFENAHTLNLLVRKMIDNQALLNQLNKEYVDFIMKSDRKDEFVFKEGSS